MFRALVRALFRRDQSDSTRGARDVYTGLTREDRAVIAGKLIEELEAADKDIPPPARPVLLSPRALEMLEAPKKHAAAVREANKPAEKQPLKGSLEWRIQEAKRAKGLLR